MRKIYHNSRPTANGLKENVAWMVFFGRSELTQDTQHFPRMPQQPLTREQLREKFNAVTAAASAAGADRIFDRIAAVEKIENMRGLA